MGRSRYALTRSDAVLAESLAVAPWELFAHAVLGAWTVQCDRVQWALNLYGLSRN